MDSTKTISKKIALLGHHAVGKTSLISQFVENKFPESYLTTIGLKVDKKSISLDGYTLNLMIWDIAGQESMTDIPQYYLNGCSGFIYVIDLSRPSTYENIQSQLMLMQGMMPEAVRVVAGNKKDLLSEEDLEKVVGECAIKPEILTSAKFDQNVEELFQALAGKMLANHETT